MRDHIRKFIRGKQAFSKEEHSGYQLHFHKIQDVWNGDKQDDYGLLRIFRLFIVSSLLLFPGVLIDEIFRSKSYITRKLIVELYVFLKTVFPIFVLLNGWYHHHFIFYLSIYLLIETYLYLFSKIFLEYQHLKVSNMRTLLLLVFNFFESGLTFAVIYIAGNYLNIPLKDTVDAIYFSFVTSATIGYGDIHPVNETWKLIVTTQIFSSISFLVLFFNFFSGRAHEV